LAAGIEVLDCLDAYTMGQLVSEAHDAIHEGSTTLQHYIRHTQDSLPNKVLSKYMGIKKL